MAEFDVKTRELLFNYILGIADDRLILGHRLSEWCGHAPIIEEDIAMANIALDCIGEADAFYKLAATFDTEGRSADDLAFLRDSTEFRNAQLSEQPNTDFAWTIARQFFTDAFYVQFFEDLTKSSYEELAAPGAKALKEVKYHLRHSREWILRLGDGTEESNSRLQDAVDNLWMYTREFFEFSDNVKLLYELDIVPDNSALLEKWKETVLPVLKDALITIPEDPPYFATGGRSGLHTEHLGHLLAEMQVLPRTYPDAKW